MALGTVGLNGARCSDCLTMLPLKVCHTSAGFYLGYWCSTCGPFSRETGYFETEEEARVELRKVNNGETPRKVRI